MESYPGEKSDIPKRILDALKEQPLTYLVPKDGLVSLIDNSIRLNIDHEEPNFENATQVVDLTFSNESEPIIFRRPINIEHLLDERDSEVDITQSLSDMAKMFLPELSIRRENILQDDSDLSLKRKCSSSSVTLDDSVLDLTNTSDIKRANTSIAVSMNQISIAEQYTETLVNMVNDISSMSVTDQNNKNIENWKTLENGSSVITTSCLSKLQLIIKNIIKYPQGGKNIPTATLQKILEMMTNNIDTLKVKSTDNLSDLNISLLSTEIIFMVYLIDNESKELVLDRYVSVPIDFITELIIELKNREGNFPENILSLLLESISPLPKFLSVKSFIDEEIITKFVYLFVDIIFLNQNDTNMISKTSKLLNDIKSIGHNILGTLFNKFPAQRDFILNELLALTENIPTKRNLKKLYPIESDVFVTSFTYIVLELLSNLHIYNHCMDVKDWSQEQIDTVLKLHDSNIKSVKKYSDMISENIIMKLNDNTIKTRHILENYVQDLAQLLTNPQWPITRILLDSITKRLLMIFKSNQTNNINLEIAALQNLATIFCVIFKIKLQFNMDKKDYTCFDIASDKNLFMQYSSFFDSLISYNCSKNKNSMATGISWEMKLDFLNNIKLTLLAGKENEGRNVQFIDEALSTHLQTPATDLTTNSETDINTSINGIISIGNLYRLYDSYLKTVLALLSNEKAKLRSAAIKNLSTLASHDQTILTNFLVKQTIQRRLSDSSSSVKDAILDLISIGTSYLDYFEEINGNFNDDNVSVRKHVLKLNERIYDNTEDLQIKIFVASRILLRIEDEEDSLISIAKELLLDKWIIYPSNTVGNEIDADTEKLQSVQEVMVHIFSMGDKYHELLDNYLNYYLLNSTYHSTEKNKLIVNILNKMVNILVEKIISIYSDNLTTVSDKLQKYLNLLTMFSDSMVPFITKDHLFSLYPYLFSGNNRDVQLCILYVFKNTIGKLNNFKIGFLEDLQKTILANLTKLTTQEIETCIPLLWNIGLQTNNFANITKAASSCISQLSVYVESANHNSTGMKPDGKIQRLICISANIARYCKLEEKGEKIKILLDNETYCEYVAKCLLILSKQDIPHLIRKVSIKHLIKICSNFPKLFNSRYILEIIDLELSGNDEGMQIIILQSLYEFFMEEERKSSRIISTNSTILSNRTKPKKMENRKNNSSDTICFSLVTKYLKYFLNKSVIFDNKKLAEISTKLLYTIIKFNFVNPSHCLPTLMALLISPDEKQRSITKAAISNINENFQSILFASLTKGIESTMIYAESVYNKKFITVDSFLIDLQSYFLQDMKGNQKFLKVLTKLLYKYTSILLNKGCTEKELNQIAFYCVNLSKLVLKNQQELLIVAKTLDSISEDFKEYIIQKLRVASELSKDNKNNLYLRNLITVQILLHDLTLHLLDKYDLGTDILFFDNDDIGLRQHLIQTSKGYEDNFYAKYDEIRTFWSSNSLSRYLNLVDNSID
ncbi:hypothetical protein RNJ44_04712 [Nakaseomyces bracarensis]|uniref:Sister chromatid cohesion protein n=1 Tax=Nakaseomyces bracarensis TaxID=273131 RepID=A0ABR4NVN6_9SACH